MKLLLILLVLFCSSAYGQRNHRNVKDTLRKADSLEVWDETDGQFKILTDTLPIYIFDENNVWREMKLVTYYHDSVNTLRKISYQNGQEGNYHFYFEGGYLRKVRVLKEAGFINCQYYFTAEQNQLTVSQVQQKLAERPQMKDIFELLQMSQSLVAKFKSLQ